MFAQAVRFQLKPGMVDEATEIFKSSVLPAVQQQQGFKRVHLLVDEENNRGIGLSYWETRADVDAIASSGFYQEQIAKFAAVFAGPPEREVYEIRAEA